MQVLLKTHRRFSFAEFEAWHLNNGSATLRLLREMDHNTHEEQEQPDQEQQEQQALQEQQQRAQALLAAAVGGGVSAEQLQVALDAFESALPG